MPFTPTTTRKWIVVDGNPVDGLCFIGPFKTADEARQYAEEHYGNEDWWTASLVRP